MEEEGISCPDDLQGQSTVHTGVFALKIISDNAVLLAILISTTFAPLRSGRGPKEAKNYKELEFLGLSRCFSIIIE